MITPEDLLTRKFKPMWKARHSEPYAFICPQCTGERKVPLHPQPATAMNFFRIGLVTAVFALACWPVLGWKGLVAFVPFWAIFEFYYRTKVRNYLSCPQCGFDPYLYLWDVKKARGKVETFWRKKFADQNIPYPGDELAAEQNEEITSEESAEELPEVDYNPAGATSHKEHLDDPVARG